MTVRLYEWDKNETGWAWIEVTDNKVINLVLRSLNNLIKINSNNEVYTDLQLDDNLLSTATLPVGVTTGRVLQANGRPVTWTLILAKTTSGDNVKILYGDDGEIRVDNGTGVWKNITTAYFKTQAEYDALPSRKNSDWNLYIIVDTHLNPIPWSQLADMPLQDALDYLNEHPAEYMEWYYNNGDVVKEDLSNDYTLPAGTHRYAYKWPFNNPSPGGYLIIDDTDLTSQQLETLGILQEDITDILSEEWYSRFNDR